MIRSAGETGLTRREIDLLLEVVVKESRRLETLPPQTPDASPQPAEDLDEVRREADAIRARFAA